MMKIRESKVESSRKVMLPIEKGASRKMVVLAVRLLLIRYRLLNVSSGRITVMQLIGSIKPSTRACSVLIGRLLRARGWSLLTLWIITVAAAVGAQSVPKIPLGVAWQVKGSWRVDGGANPIQTGDTIAPGSLLWPIEGSPVHSITLLLPDGQRILYECFLAADCRRGFRVPPLYRNPDPQATGILWRIHAAVTTTAKEPEVALGNGTPTPRDEAVTVLDAQSRGQVTGLVSALSDGRYTYTVRAFGHSETSGPRKILEKKGAFVVLEIPSPGLYDVIVTDPLNTPRVDLLVAAVKAPQAANLQASFRNAKVLLKDWNDDFQGWPIHDFQRAYLEALTLGINPQVPRALTAGVNGSKSHPGEVAEPVFIPGPGVMRGDTAVTLRCDTPGATIHFTTDNSQPFTSSAVYSAPIMVKGTALTIKAFATANGKDPSAVVTGIFRIRE